MLLNLKFLVIFLWWSVCLTIERLGVQYIATEQTVVALLQVR